MKKKVGQFLKYFIYLFAIIFILIAILVAAIQIPAVQKYFVQLSTTQISKSLGTEISVGDVSIDFLSRIHLNNVLIRDYKKDTLIFVGTIYNKHIIDYAIGKPFQFIDESLSMKHVKLYLDNSHSDGRFNITKTFARKKSSPKTTDTSRNNSPRDLSVLKLGQIHIEDAEFRLRDSNNYQTLHARIREIEIDAIPLQLSTPIWKLNSMSITQPEVTLTHHIAPKSPKNYKPEYLTIPITLDLNQLKLNQGRLRVIDEPIVQYKDSKQLYFTDLDVKDINIKSHKVSIRKHSIKGVIDQLEAREKSGLEIQKLQTEFFLNSFRTEAKNLIFKSNHSNMNGYLRFDYKHMREYLRFAAWVKVTANMKNSNLSLRDITYFAPSLRDWQHLDMKFSTHGYGTMNDLLLTHLKGSMNQGNLSINGDAKVLDLFSGKGPHVIAKLNQVGFEKRDIEFVFQKKGLPNELTTLGRVNYIGQFTGNPIKFTLDGRVNTLQGIADLKSAQFDFTSKERPLYKGNIQLYKLKLNTIITGGSAVDNLSANLYVDGQGFDMPNLKTYLKGDVSSVHINQKDYQNFKVDGVLEDKIFKGNIISNDPSLSFVAQGKVSLKEASPSVELNVNLNQVDLQKIGISKHKLLLNANVFGIGRGKNLDEMLGTMTVGNMFISDIDQQGKRYDFSNITIEKDVFEESYNKYININSEEINASMVGKFRISDIPSLLKDYFISYLTVSKSNTTQTYSNTYFNLNIGVKNISNYTRVLYPELKNVENGQMQVRFNGLENNMKVEGRFFNTSYLSFKFPQIHLVNNSSNQSLNTILDIDSVFFNKKLAITPLHASVSQAQEGLNLSLELLNRTDDKFVDFNSVIKKIGDDYTFHIKPFTSYFGRKVWTLHPDNLIVLNPTNQSIKASNLELYKDIQTIKISNNQMDYSALDIKFEEVKLQELISGFLPNLKLFKGNLNGEISIANVMKNPTPVSNLDVKDIEWNNEKIGNLTLSSHLTNEILNSKAVLIGENYHIHSNIYFDAKTGVDSLNAALRIYKIRPLFVNKILNNLVTNLDGNIHGDVTLYGPLNRLNALGTIHIDTLSTKLNILQTTYHTSKQTIQIIPDKIILSEFKIIDQENNTGIADGFIAYNHLNRFDLFIDAISPKLLCLNTTPNDNIIFNGKVYADAKAQFRGTIGDRIFISAQGRNLPNSLLTIGFESSQRTDRYNFYEFIHKDSNTSKSNFLLNKRQIGGVNLDFDFDINRFGKLFIMMDPASEDRIECTGDGRIAFKMTPESDVDIKGSYEIYSGTYLFTYRDLVQRLFYLNKGGQMTFIGNPRASLIDASATFSTRASAQDLITAYFGNTDNSRITSASKTNVKAIILLKLKDKITQPSISYELNVEHNNPEVASAFESITSTTRNNEAELNKQVVGLLLYQRFFPPSLTGFNSNQSSTNSVGTDFQNTLFDVFTGKISNYVSDWMQNTFQGMNFGLSYKNYSQFNQTDQANANRNELKIAISQKLLNDRLIFNLGGNYDFGRSQFTSSNSAFFGGDIDIEYILTPTGNVRTKFYSTLSNDPLNSIYINKTGMGILFQKEFDEFNQIFKKSPLR